jgi:hypothetical protein
MNCTKKMVLLEKIQHSTEVFGCFTEQTHDFSPFARRASYLEERIERNVAHGIERTAKYQTAYPRFAVSQGRTTRQNLSCANLSPRQSLPPVDGERTASTATLPCAIREAHGMPSRRQKFFRKKKEKTRKRRKNK